MVNRKLCGALGVAAVVTVALVSTGGGAHADPPGMLSPNQPPVHRHFIVQEDGTLIPVGPNLCENPNLRQAFNEFHFNIHHSQVPGIGDIETLGPQNGAPGLHNGHGAEIVGVGGCGG